jgi:hypothetical protein
MSIGLAINQVQRIEGLCNFLEHPVIKETVEKNVPVTMPRDVGAFGFDTPIWIGLGIVGIWAALDAYAERHLSRANKCSVCGRRCLGARYVSIRHLIPGAVAQALDELDDLRNLFAHNFAGDVDAEYLSTPRHILRPNAPIILSSGAHFSGTHVDLKVQHLRYYCACARKVFENLS